MTLRIDTGRNYSIGLRDLEIRPGQTREITARTEIVIYPQRFVIPRKYGEHFVVLDLKFGNRSQLQDVIEASPHEVLATMFAEDVEAKRRAFDPVFIGQAVTLYVKNISAETRQLYAILHSYGLDTLDLFKHLGLPIGVDVSPLEKQS